MRDPHPARARSDASRYAPSRARGVCLLLLVGSMTLGTGASAVDFQNLTLTPNSKNHLAAFVEFETSVAITPLVTVAGPVGTWTVPAGGVLSTAPGTLHRVLVVGLESEQSYTVTVADSAGALEPADLQYSPGPMPAEFPAINISVSNPGQRSPGFTLVGINDIAGSRTWLVVLDAEGDPRWYWRRDASFFEGITGIQWLPSGGAAFATYDWTQLRVVDLAGEMTDMPASALGLDNFHHDLQLTPAGNLFTVSTTLTHYDEFPGEIRDINLVGEVLSEIGLDGAILRQWDLVEILDPFRSVANGNFWTGTYPDAPRLREWGHVNGFYYDGSDDSIVVSALGQEALFKFDAKTKELLWIIGVDRADSTEDNSWPFLTRIGPGGDPDERRHSAHSVAGRYVYTYANRSGGSGSTGLGLDIDVEAGEYEEIFAWNDPTFGPIGGDCDLLPNGNAMIFDGSSSGGQRLAEVRTSDNVKVFDAVFPGSASFGASPIVAPAGMPASDLPTLLYPADIFADGFESGGLCGWALAAPAPCPSR